MTDYALDALPISLMTSLVSGNSTLKYLQAGISSWGGLDDKPLSPENKLALTNDCLKFFVDTNFLIEYRDKEGNLLGNGYKFSPIAELINCTFDVSDDEIQEYVDSLGRKELVDIAKWVAKNLSEITYSQIRNAVDERTGPISEEQEAEAIRVLQGLIQDETDLGDK